MTLEVTWRVEERPGGSVLASKRSVFTVPLAGGANGPDAYVERLSQAIALWSKEIATAIRKGCGAVVTSEVLGGTP